MAYLTRKDFIIRATIISMEPDVVRRESEAQKWAAVFAGTNPRFDRARFFVACGVQV